MNSFGLGLILSFTDNASAGMRRASQTFNEMNRISDQMVSASGSAVSSIETLSLAGYGLNVVGDQMTSVGSTIVSVFGSASQSIINTGLELGMFERQIAALYGDNRAKSKIAEIQQYAQDSVFSVRDLTSAVVMMKAVGIEAMDDITTTTGSTTQTLLDYASDLAAMYPTMHNVYGTGVNAAMGALKEYIAEGNARSLKAGAGLDITEMLGQDKGKSIEERTQQVADLIDMMGIAGYTTSLLGTPTQQLEKMQDALYNAMGRIANEGGVLSKYTGMLSTVATYVENLVKDEERMNTLITIVGDALSSLLDPLQSVVEHLMGLVESFISFAETHPQLSKFIVKAIAITGVALVAIGTVMKLSGSFLILFASIKTVSDLLKSGKGLKNISRLLGIFKANFLPFIALAGLAYVAWKNNFFGIRDVITKTFQDVGTIISLISDAFVDNELSIDQFEKAKQLGILPLIESVLMLKYYAGKLFEGFKIGIEGFLETLSELTRSWGLFDSDVFGTAENLGDFLKSLTQPGAEDTWRAIGEVIGKVLVTTLLLYSTFKAMSGVIKIFKGIAEVIKFIGKVFTPVVKLFKWFGTVGSLMKEGFGFSEVMSAAFPKISGFVTKLVGGFTKVITVLKKVGAFIAKILPKITPILSKIGSVVVKLFAKIGPLFTKVGSVIAKIGSVVVKLFTKLGPLFAKAGAVIAKIASALGISVGWVVAIIVAIAGVVTAIIVFRKQIAQFFKDLWVKIVDAFNKAKESIVNLIPKIKEKLVETFNKAKDAVLGIVAKIKDKMAEIILKIKDFFTPVVDFFKEVWERASAIISSIVGAFKAGFNLIKTVVQAVSNVVSAIFNVIYQAVRWVALSIALFFKNAFIFVRDNVIQPIVDFFTQAFQWVKDNVIAPICNFFISAWQAVVDFITQAFDWIMTNVITPVCNFFIVTWQAVVNFIAQAIQWVKTNVITPICTFFIGAWQSVINFISQAIQWVRDSILTPIANFFIGLWQGVVNFVSQAFQWLKDTVFAPIADFFIGVWQGVVDFMTSVIDWFVQAFTNIREFIDGVLTFVRDKFFGILDAITEKVTSFFDGIKEVFNWIADKIEGIGSWLTDGINKVADYIKNDADNKEQQLVGAATGGYVKTTGIGVLHPNELVVNDKMTQQLGAFLDNQTALSVAPVPIGSTTTKSVGGQNVNSEGYIDNSVTFAAGSVVIQMNNASDAELEKVAEKLMKIIARKQQLKGMAVRK